MTCEKAPPSVTPPLPASDGGGHCGRRRGWCRLARGLGGIAFLVCLVAATGAIYDAVASSAEGERFPVPSALIQTDGVRLHLQCFGSGSPTVVFDSGLGVPALGWSLVWPGVSRFTRACAYDRAGYGYSDPPDSFPRTSARVAMELHTLRMNAGIGAPYVLVGHSLAGHNVRVFTGAYPQEVSGIVFVDAAQEEMTTRLPPTARRSLRAQPQMFRLGVWASRLGLLRLWPSLSGFNAESPSLRSLPPETVRALIFLTLQPKALRAAASEIESLDESGAQARAAGTLGDRPLVVIASGRDAGLPRTEAAEYRRVWVEELQPALSRLSTRGRLIVLDSSGHLIPFEEPNVVVETVREVVTRARGVVSER